MNEHEGEMLQTCKTELVTLVKQCQRIDLGKTFWQEFCANEITGMQFVDETGEKRIEEIQ